MRYNAKHGHTTFKGKPSPTWTTWWAMISRCRYPNHNAYKNYGGRGITVCDRWAANFANFLDDMGERPHGMTLDRYPNKNGNYEPSNCRWATRSEQQINRRKRFSDDDIRLIRSVKIKGTLLARLIGVTNDTIYDIRNRKTYNEVA